MIDISTPTSTGARRTDRRRFLGALLGAVVTSAIGLRLAPVVPRLAPLADRAALEMFYIPDYHKPLITDIRIGHTPIGSVDRIVLVKGRQLGTTEQQLDLLARADA